MQFFTLAIGGMCTMVNLSGGAIYPGGASFARRQCPESTACARCQRQSLPRSRPAHAQCLADVLEWTFCPKGVTGKPGSRGMRGTSNPRRISVKVTTQASERAIGRAISFSKHGEAFDLLLKAT